MWAAVVRDLWYAVGFRSSQIGRTKTKTFLLNLFLFVNGSTGLCFTTMTIYVCFCFHFGQNFGYRDISFLPVCYPTFALRHLLSMSNAPYLFAIRQKVLHTTLSSDIRFPDLLGQQIFANWFSYDLLLRLLLLVLNGCETFAIQDICYLRHLLSETITIFYDTHSLIYKDT